MLILSRRIGESLIVNDDIVVTVIGIKGNQIQLGITAPKEVFVHREEIYQRIQNEKIQDQNSNNLMKTNVPVPIIVNKHKHRLKNTERIDK